MMAKQKSRIVREVESLVESSTRNELVRATFLKELSPKAFEDLVATLILKKYGYEISDELYDNVIEMFKTRAENNSTIANAIKKGA